MQTLYNIMMPLGIAWIAFLSGLLILLLLAHLCDSLSDFYKKVKVNINRTRYADNVIPFRK